MLLEKVIQNRKIKSDEKFKKISEESYNWFNGDEFLDMFLYPKTARLIISRKEDTFSKRQYSPQLPFTDSEGEIELIDIQDYLLGQGFEVSTASEANYHQEYVLVIKLPKGE